MGEGSLWAPLHTATDGEPFFEHPPLGFALEAIGFSIFGDSFFVERGFSLLVFGLHALLIMATWRRLMPVRYDWLPLFFWILPASVTWSVVNNMLENTQALFTTAAVYCLIRALGDNSARAEYRWAILAGVAVTAATLTKGPVGLFPLAVPLMLPLLPRAQPPRRLFTVWMTTIAVVAAAAMTLAAFQGPRHDIAEYLRRQVGPSLRGQRELASSKFAILGYLGWDVIGKMSILAAALRWFGLRSGRAMPGSNSATWFFLTVGLVASIPIAASPKMSGHYFVPSAPFFALAAGAFVRPALDWFDQLPPRGWGERVPLILAAALLVAAIGLPLARGPIEPRDLETVASLDAIASATPRGATIGTCRASQYDWGTASYMQRFFRVSLDARDAPVEDWFLSINGACAPPSGCRPAASGNTLALYQCLNAP